MWITRHQKEIMTQLISCLFLVACLKCSAASVPVVVSIDEIGDQITTFTGGAEDYVFGAKVLSLGDINGDGFEDMAIFAESSITGEENLSYIFYGRESLPQSVDMAEWHEWGIRLRSLADERSAFPVQGIGDLNQDGFDDVAFGSWPVAEGEECYSLVLFGDADLPNDIDTSSFDGCRVMRIDYDENATHGGSIGLEITSGDINGDGLNDLIASEYRAYRDDMVVNAGIVYVIFGADPLPDSINLTNAGTIQPGFIMYSTSPGKTEGFGNKICSGIDFDGDGIDDLVVGSYAWNRVDTPPGEYEGAFFVVFGREGWPVEFVVDANQAGVCHIVGLEHFERISRDILHAKYDVDGDSVPDIFCSGVAQDTYLVSGRDLSPGRFLMDEIMTTQFDYDKQLLGMGMHNWNGDEIGDMVFGSTCQDTVTPDIQDPGSVFILPGRTGYPDISRLGLEGVPRYQITGVTTHYRLGKQLCTADINGDGLSDIVTSAYCDLCFVMEPPEGSPPGRVFIIPGGTDLKRVFKCLDFTPKGSPLSGGGDLRITGAGFDENTLVYIGDKEVDITKMEDSRTIVATIPETEGPGSMPIRIERGDESLVFEQQFEYYESLFPRGLNILELGDRGCTIIEPKWQEDPYTLFTKNFESITTWGGDFNGDGLGDILITRGASINQRLLHYKEYQEILLLYGTKELPKEITTEEFSEWGGVFIADREVNETFGYNAILTGDMNGDGSSELAIWAKRTNKVFIVFGGPAVYGEKSVYELLDEGRCCVIENVQYDTPKLLVRCGDVNGDGLDDLALSGECTLAIDDIARSSLVFVLGREAFPTSMSYDELPKLYGKPGSMYFTKGAGDVDGDGRDDIVFRSDFDNEVNRYCIYFGRKDMTEDAYYEDEIQSEGLCIIFNYASNLYTRVSGIGDQNGDRNDDLAVYSIPHYGSYCVPKQAKLRILYGGSRDNLSQLRNIRSDDDFDLNFTTDDEEHGRLDRITGGRDINYDGFPDILIRDHHGDFEGMPPPSKAIVLFGGNLEEKEGPLNEVTGKFEFLHYHIGPGESGVQFPMIFDFAGDVNGDGYEDIIMSDHSRFYIYYNPLGGTVYRDFIRGDTNLDGKIDIADAIAVLQHLYSVNAPLDCFDAGDANDDEKLDLADPIYILTHLFANGAPPPPPNECGQDPFGTLLDCRKSSCP